VSHTEEDRRAVEAVVRAHGENFVRQDLPAQLALWDDAYENVTLLPTERLAPIETWREISEYYATVIPQADVPLSISMNKWEISDLTIDFLSDDVAYALALVDSEYDIVNDEPIPQLFPGYGPRDGKWLGRLTYIIRRSEPNWKIIHCEDSTHDVFRANQLAAYHDCLVAQAIELLTPIVNPPIETSLTPGSSRLET
jgi:hypothetical protein